MSSRRWETDTYRRGRNRNSGSENRNYQRRDRDNQSQRYHNRSFDNSWNNQQEWDKSRDSTYSSHNLSQENWDDPQEYNEPSTYHRSERRYDQKRDMRNRSQLVEGLVIYVHNDHIRKLIGKGGSQIKSLEAESNARIKVSNETVVHFTEDILMN